MAKDNMQKNQGKDSNAGKDAKDAKKDTDEKGITVKKEDDMPEWYGQVVIKSQLADYSPIKGCMVIRPNGYAVWQNITDYLNEIIKKKGVRNAYFPLFIPESFFKREAKHAEGFSPEVAWVAGAGDGTDKGERLAIRPTSETIMYDSYSRWIRSWRDLPLRINQWCNIVRWEVSDVKLFLRSREFLWQEGHCVYESEKECEDEALGYLHDYKKVAEDLLAIPVILGEKTEKERFAGAKKTFTIEGFMADGKALQMGTSHNLGQGFAKAFDITYKDQEEKDCHPWQNSWGISTRMIGAMVMTHSDNKGLVLPPRVAENKIVIVPIIFDKSKEIVLEKCKHVFKELKEYNPILDDRDEYTSGWKFNEYELKGIPLRVEIGPKDVEKGHAVVVRRDTGEKEFVKLSHLKERIDEILDMMHNHLLDSAREHLKRSMVEVDTWEEFMHAAEKRKLIFTNFCGEEGCEDVIKTESGGVTSRCIPLEWNMLGEHEKKRSLHDKVCVKCGKPATVRCYFAKNY